MVCVVLKLALNFYASLQSVSFLCPPVPMTITSILTLVLPCFHHHFYAFSGCFDVWFNFYAVRCVRAFKLLRYLGTKSVTLHRFWSVTVYCFQYTRHILLDYLSARSRMHAVQIMNYGFHCLMCRIFYYILCHFYQCSHIRFIKGFTVSIKH